MTGARGYRLWLSALLPLLGILAMVGRAEWTVRTGDLWQVPIEGYDPRDLLSGHYLIFRFGFEKDRPPNCSPGRGFACCVCLTKGSQGGQIPDVSWVEECSKPPQSCDSWVPAESLDSLHRFYVPEGEGLRLEKEVREKRASIGLAVRKDGGAAIQELYLDGKPWR